MNGGLATLAQCAAPIVLDSAAKSAVLLAATGLLVVGLMRKRSAAERHLVWFLAMVGVFALPVLSGELPGWRILPRWLDWQPETRTVAPSSQNLLQMPTQRTAISEPENAPSQSSDMAQESRTDAGQIRDDEPVREVKVVPTAMSKTAVMPTQPDFAGWGIAGWAAGVVLALIPTLFGLASLWWLERNARRETGLSWLALLQRLVSALRIRRPVALLKSARRRMPMTWGVLRPRLLLPEESEAWPEERRRVVMLHELAHARRWDFLTNLVTRLACALYWFNPLVWLAARQMVIERERACDDIVLRHGAKPADYAEQILGIATALRSSGFAGYGAIAMARSTNLEGRLKAILDGRRNRAALTRVVALAVLIGMMGILLPVAALKGAPKSMRNAATKNSMTDVVNSGDNSESADGDLSLDDDALRCYLGQSDLVVIGKRINDNWRSGHPDDFNVEETIKGEPQGAWLKIGTDHGWPGPNVEFPEGETVLFLWRHAERGTTNLEGFWRPRDIAFGALPATPELVSALKRVAPSVTAESGEAQIGALLREFAPDCTLRAVKYHIGNQSYSSAVLVWGLGFKTLDRREMKWPIELGRISATNSAATNECFASCPKIGGDLWESAAVSDARAAEDYTRLVIGLCAGPRALEKWRVTAQPFKDDWLVTPTYIGPPAKVREVKPIELLMNTRAGKVVGLREARPDYRPGQMADVPEQPGLNPDGLDPAPAAMDDATLDYYMSRCETVVGGHLTTSPGVGFSEGLAISFGGEFMVTDSIKGKATQGSAIHVTLTRRDGFLKKDEPLVLFLDYGGAQGRYGPESSPSWERIWGTVDVDFGEMLSSPKMLAELKRLAALHGPSLETPNLNWGSQERGLEVQLGAGYYGLVWKPGRDYAVQVRIANRGTNEFLISSNAPEVQLEVDGLWYQQRNQSIPLNAPEVTTRQQVESSVTVGSRWTKVAADGQTNAIPEEPLDLTIGKHRLRFAIMVKQKPLSAGRINSEAIRAVSNPLEIEVRQDDFSPPSPRPSKDSNGSAARTNSAKPSGVITNSDTAQHGPAVTNSFDNPSVEEQVRELIARLPEQTAALMVNNGKTYVVLTLAPSSKAPAEQLLGIGYPAVPQLIEALTNSTPCQAQKGRMNTNRLTVADCAEQILEVISGRHFLSNSVSAYYSDGDRSGAVRDKIQSWWSDVMTKGEKEALIEGVLAADKDSPAQADLLQNRYPEAITSTLLEALAVTNSPVHGQLLGHLSNLNSPQVTAFLQKELYDEKSLSDRVQAANGLRARGIDVVPPMIHEWEKLVQRTTTENPSGLLNFLGTCDSAPAIQALQDNLGNCPELLRAWIIRCLGETAPKTDSADTQNAIEQCLVTELEDKEECGIVTWGNSQVSYDSRNCDLAARYLAKRWPERYTFDYSPGLSIRERERVISENVWRQAHHLDALPLPPSPSNTVSAENANEVTSIEWTTDSVKPNAGFLASAEAFRGKPLNATNMVAFLNQFSTNPQPQTSGLDLKFIKDVDLTGVCLRIQLIPGVMPGPGQSWNFDRLMTLDGKSIRGGNGSKSAGWYWRSSSTAGFEKYIAQALAAKPETAFEIWFKIAARTSP